ncbi:MAG: SCO family protein, partial [Proteobacteria bacterium]|nr:SCO family protein [Pseudomonadota bacterium]
MKRRPLLAAACTALLSACGRKAPPSFASTDITGVPWGKDFHLTDHRGRPRTLADFRGKVVMLFFGYTHCPDVCPTSLTNMARVRKLLGPDGSRVQGLFVTLDPKRDTPQVLAQYVPAFDPGFLGLYGDKQATAAAAADFKVFFAAQKPDEGGNYTIDHSSGIFVFDPQG